MATRRPAHNTPIHMDLVPFERQPYKKSMWIGVMSAGLRVAMWITHVGSKFRHGLLENVTAKRFLGLLGSPNRVFGGPKHLLRFFFYQDKFDHDKGQKSAISGRRLHWRLSTGFFVFSPVFMCNLVRRAPQNLEKVAKNPVEKIASNPVTSVAVMVSSALILSTKLKRYLLFKKAFCRTPET